MMGFKISKRVAAPLDRVFEVFSDIPRSAERLRAVRRIEVLTEGPVRAGTRWRETRITFQRESTDERELTSIEPNRSYTVEGASHGIHHCVEFRFVPEGDATRVDVHVTSRPLTWLAWLTAPFGWLVMGSVKRCIEQDLSELKELIESQQATARGAASPRRDNG